MTEADSIPRGRRTVVYLVVETGLPEDDVKARLGSAGRSRRFHKMPSGRDKTEWSLQLAVQDSAYRAILVADERLAELPTALGDSIRALSSTDQDASIALVIAQDLTESSATHGFRLRPGTVAWLASVGAAVVVDQAVYASLSPTSGDDSV